MFVVNEIVSTCLATGIVKHLLQISWLVGCSVKAVENIVADVTWEKNWLLLYDRNLLVVPLRVEGVDVTAIEQHLSLARLVKLLNQRDNWTLAAARTSHKSYDSLLRRNINIDSSKHLDIFAHWIWKLNIHNIDLSFVQAERYFSTRFSDRYIHKLD